MPIKFACPECQKTLKVEERLIGKRVSCPGCQAKITIPAGETIVPKTPASPKPVEPPPEDDFGNLKDDFGNPEDDPYYGMRKSKKPDSNADDESPPPVKKSKRSAEVPNRRVELSARASVTSGDGSRNHLHWLFALALVPLGLFMIWKDEATFAERLEKTLIAHPEIAPQLQQIPAADGLEGLFDVLPGNRLDGAHLARRSWMHWLYAVLSVFGFVALLTKMFPDSEVTSKQLLLTGIATGTVGILLLLGFQWVAGYTQGFNLRGRSIVVVLFYIVKFIGFSYRCALEEGNGFGLSFMGFTMGVGLCEEICKAIPVAIFLNSTRNASWKGACLIGLASGIGFGVSEGITYSSDFYNGVSGFSIYLVRFVSCVALHSLWSGCVALLMVRNQDYVSDIDWESLLGFVVYYLSIAMILHGLYDTLLKQEYHWQALLIAAGSFGWFVFMVSRQPDDE